MLKWWKRRKTKKLEVEQKDAGQQAYDDLNAYLLTVDTIRNWEKATGVPRIAIAVGMVLVACYAFLRIAGLSAFSNVLGLVYPSWASFRTIESDLNVDEYIHWLMYWIVFGSIHLIELITDPLVEWGPYFYSFKIAFLVWCFMPSSMGATSVYATVIHPLLKHHEIDIDEHIANARSVSGQAASEIGRAGSVIVSQAAMSMAHTVMKTLAEEDELDNVPEEEEEDGAAAAAAAAEQKRS